MPYELQVGVLTRDAHIEAGSLLGARATVSVQHAETLTAYRGVVASAEIAHAWGALRLYRIRMVPKLWHLSQTLHSRVYVDVSVMHVVEQILEQHGIRHRRSGSFRPSVDEPLEHICQYRESDLAFISRLLEREGAYYFFDHGGDEEELVIEDARPRVERAPAVRYAPAGAGGAAPDGSYLSSFVCRHEAIPGTVELTAYDYTSPNREVHGRTELGEATTVMSLFNESDGRSQGRLESLLGVRAEELRARAVTYRGSGTVFGVHAGGSFTVGEHPVDAMNQAYVATEVRVAANEAEDEPLLLELLGLPKASFEVSVVAVADGVQYRPPRRVPVPRIDGVETGIVESGDAGTHAFLDEHGRYRVRLHFDERHRDGDGTQVVQHGSCWIRMLQPHAGAPEGAHLPLRAGTEVMVLFLGGDPDRPVIAGAVPNHVTPSVVAQRDHSRNVVHTGSNNRLMLEDAEERERVELSTPAGNSRIGLGAAPSGSADGIVAEDVTPPGIRMRTDDNLTTAVGKDHDATVSGDENILVEGDHYGHYAKTSDTDVDGDCTVHVGGDLTLTVDGDMIEKVTGSLTRVVESTTSLIYTKAYSTSYVSAVNKNYASAVNENYVSAVNSNYASAVNENFVSAVNRNFVSAVNENYLSLYNANFIGISLNNYLAASSDNYIGASQAFYLAAKAEVRAAASVVLGAAADLNMNLALAVDMWAGLKLSLALGANFDMTVGFKFETNDAGKVVSSTFQVHV